MLDKREQFGLLKSIELPVSQVLHGMEQVGAQVDMTRLVQMRDQLAADAAQAQETAWQFAGEQVNLQSPKQLQKILFEDMGLKPTKKKPSPVHTPPMPRHCRPCVTARTITTAHASSLTRC